MDKIQEPPRIIEDLIFEDETYAIMGATFETHKNLGAGFLEPVYQEAFEYELSERKIPFISQPNLQIWYKDFQLSKTYKADLVAFNKIIIELKAIDSMGKPEEAQVFNYLRATGLQLGILINFGAQKLEWKRLVLTDKKLAELAKIRVISG